MTQWGLDAIFNPAKRHMDEEKQRLAATRQEVGDSSGGDRIDLESGKVVIRAAGAGGAADTETDAEPGAEAAAEPGAQHEAAEAASGAEPDEAGDN